VLRRRPSDHAEALALSRAVGWHSGRRVLLNGYSTVVFR
jgi:formyltetrahydrofolate deformylase